MKNVLLSTDSEVSVFSVPDKVADNLEKYCLDYCCDWMHKSPDAAKYRVQMGDTVGVCGEEDLPKEYIGLPYFNF